MNKYIPDLTGVRAIAAYLIFFSHYAVSNIFREFHIGVTIFFVLSGFLITYLYYQSAMLNRVWIKNFYVKRFARIYPVLALTTIVGLILLKDSDFKIWFLSLSLLKGFSAQYVYTGLQQSWTLTVEAVFYLLAPFIFLLAKKGLPFWLQFTALFLIGVLISGWGHLEQLLNPAAFIESHLFLFRLTFFGQAFAFLAGVLLAKFVLIHNQPRRLIISGLLTYGGLLGVIGIVGALVSLQSPNYAVGGLSPLGVILNNLILPGIIAVFFYGLITEKTILNRILATRLFTLLGASSYTFYLIHMEPIANLLPAIAKTNIWTFFISLNLVAIIIYLVYEYPLNKLIRKILT